VTSSRPQRYLAGNPAQRTARRFRRRAWAAVRFSVRPPRPDNSAIRRVSTTAASPPAAIGVRRCTPLPPTASSWITVTQTSPFLMHAAPDPSPLTVRPWSWRRGERELQPRRTDAAGTRGRLLDGRAADRMSEDLGLIRGRRKGVAGESSSRPGFGRRSGPPERRGGARQCVPGRRAQQGSASQVCLRPVPSSR
jgi:hypothetical protein